MTTTFDGADLASMRANASNDLAEGRRAGRHRPITSVVALAAVLTVLMNTPAAHAAGECPALGDDTDCGTVITISDSGTTVSSTGQGPYDGGDDTLVGVVNNSSQPVRKIKLRSANPIFAFDGDGLTAYGDPGNPADSSGYAGPNTTFSDISGDTTEGVVNFTIPLAPVGGTAYFGLESALSSAISCRDAVNNAMSGPTIEGGTGISATFTPNLSLTLAEAADACGFSDIDWQQTITSLPLPSPFQQIGDPRPLSSPPFFLDPPLGGYRINGVDYPDDSYPFYYDPLGELANHQTSNTLDFFDRPADSCLPGGSGSGCGGHTAPSGSLGFATQLVGVDYDRSSQNLGIGFTWLSTFNGTSGGISATKNDRPVDVGSGSGSVAILSVQTTTDYQYNGLTVVEVNDTPVSVPNPTTTSLTATPTSAPVGSPVTLTAVVDTAAASSPTGTVAFTVGAARAGSGAPISGCNAVAVRASGPRASTAVCTTSALPVGKYAIGAEYGGDALSRASTAQAVTVTIIDVPATPPPPAPPPPPPTATPPSSPPIPRLSGLRVLPHTFKVAAARTPKKTAHAKTRRGANIKFTLSSPASVKLTFAAKRRGRFVGGRCLPQTAARRTRKPCVRYVTTGTMTRTNLPAGAQTIAFSGRVAGRKLAVGNYRVQAQPTSASGAKGNIVTSTFTIVR